jgi:hypothetical protein
MNKKVVIIILVGLLLLVATSVAYARGSVLLRPWATVTTVRSGGESYSLSARPSFDTKEWTFVWRVNLAWTDEMHHARRYTVSYPNSRVHLRMARGFMIIGASRSGVTVVYP